ncbi:MAG: GntR family transcriptional regulator [Thermomicrobiales bacterium]
MVSSLAARSHARTPRKVDVVYERLKDLIITLEIEPGAVVDERELMERLGVGRTPLRETIQRLAHEGLIEQIPRRGSWVSHLSVTDLQQMIEARRILEPVAMRLAAQRIKPAHIEVLSAQLDEAEHLLAEGIPARCVYIDQTFHRTLARVSGNRHLARMIEGLNLELIRYWYVSFVKVGGVAPAFDHHRAILNAVARGDADAAEREMHRHIDIFIERVGDMVSASDLGAPSSAPSPRNGRSWNGKEEMSG